MPTVKALSLTYAALMLLLAATAGSHFLPLGGWHVVVNLAIAAAKAGLIVFIFMNLRRGTPLVRIMSVLGITWLSILFTLTLADYLHRAL